MTDRRGDRGDRRARAPGPLSRDVLEAATGESFADLRYFRRRRVAGRRGRGRRVADRLHRRPRLRAVDRRPSGAVDVWDALMAAGRGVRHPAGRDARPRRRPPRGRAHPARGRLHLGPPRDEPRAELLARRDRARPAGRLRQGRLRRAGSRSSARRGPAARRAGWSGSSSTGTTSRGCTTRRACRRPSARRSIASPVPVFAGGRQVGRATSHGWSPILKQAIALASVAPQYEALGTDARGRVDGRGPARPGRRDGRRAAVPRPRRASAPDASTPARLRGRLSPPCNVRGARWRTAVTPRRGTIRRIMDFTAPGVPTARSSWASRPDPPTSGRAGAPLRISACGFATAATARPPAPPSRSSDRLPPGRRAAAAHAGVGRPVSMSRSPRSTTGEPIPDFADARRSARGRRPTPRSPTRAVDREAARAPAHRAPRVAGRRPGTARPASASATTLYPGGMYAAAGGRAARRRLARPTRPGLRQRPCVIVRLIDWCACGNGHIIDLYSDAFQRLAPLSSGAVRVTVSW